jgi:hypothetical protein
LLWIIPPLLSTSKKICETAGKNPQNPAVWNIKICDVTVLDLTQNSNKMSLAEWEVLFLHGTIQSMVRLGKLVATHRICLSQTP